MPKPLIESLKWQSLNALSQKLKKMRVETEKLRAETFKLQKETKYYLAVSIVIAL